MGKQPESQIFGKRAKQHVLILASGEKVRHLTIKPWLAITALSFVSVFTIGYLAATTYLVLRDDLIGASMARQARIQHEYEDRISALRAQVDRITSRQLLDQQVVEEKVEKLMEQQMALTNRHGKLGAVLERAEDSGILEKSDATPAYVTPDSADHASLSGAAFDALLTPDAKSTQMAFNNAPLRESMSDHADRLFSKVTLSLKSIEQQQLAKIENLTVGASQQADAIQSILAKSGVDVAELAAVPADNADSAIGGPFIEAESQSRFDASLTELDGALQRLEKVRTEAKKLPFANPAPGKQITSYFGNRIDPFFGKLAMHAGVDFREAMGAPIPTTGSGVVTHAGAASGYGILVEVDHGNGISTRYGHLSKVLVKEGDKVQTGDIIGEAGSTGRSTGTHLHYEVRRNDVAVDPMRFLNAGMKLSDYLR